MSKEQHSINLQAADDERIVRFLRRQMSAEEAESFRAELQNDEHLRQRAVLQARLIKQMRQVGDEQRQHIVDAMQVVSPQTIARIAAGKGEKLMPQSKGLVRRLTPWISVAAIMCCVVMVGLFMFQQRGLPSQQGSPIAAEQQIQQSASTRVRNANARAAERRQLEELATLRGKIEMGLDLTASNARLEQILREALQAEDSPLKPYINDIALALSEGYLKSGDKKASSRVMEDLQNWQDEVLMAGE